MYECLSNKYTMHCINYTSLLYFFIFWFHAVFESLYFLKQISILISGNSFHKIANEYFIIHCMQWEKIPFHTEHKYFDNKLIIKYTKWSNEKTLKIIE